MTTPEPELRATSDTLLSTLDRLAALEVEKRGLMPKDPRLVEIASEVQRLASSVLEAAEVQTALAETAHVMALTDAEGAPTRPIEAIHRPLQVILDDWRAAEREAAKVDPGSLAAAEAHTRVRALRAEYQRAYQDAVRDETRD